MIYVYAFGTGGRFAARICQNEFQVSDFLLKHVDGWKCFRRQIIT